MALFCMSRWSAKRYLKPDCKRLVAFCLLGKSEVCGCQVFHVGTYHWIGFNSSSVEEFKSFGSIVVPCGHLRPFMSITHPNERQATGRRFSSDKSMELAKKKGP
jgi:hypothetical protein